MDTQYYLQTLTTIGQQLTPWQSRFPEINDLLSLKKDFTEKVARFAAEEQKLNIAIMGQVKAGKSSFLNALLFNGHPVLPEASTPKTANLTRISWGEVPTLEVEFYSTDEWADIEKLALCVGEHAEVKVARELTTMVKVSGIDVQTILAKGIDRVQTDSLDGLLGVLNDYAGNNGQYTALVKMSRLYLPNEELKGFDVVDTPGMNDPVLSRTEKTKEEMARCDVVFFLSRCSQFLDQSDMDLLAQQLPSKGVKRMVLVAGQFDSAILDDGYDRDSLKATEDNLKKRLGKRADTEMSKLADQRQQVGRVENAQLLRNLTKPIFASTYAHGFANWPKERWGNNMKHVYDELQEMAADNWQNVQFTQADWLHIANFDALVSAYQTARADKIGLLRQQQDGLLPEAKANLQSLLQHLTQAVETRILQLKKDDLSQLSDEQKACEMRIQRLAIRLRDTVGNTLDKAEQVRREILVDLKRSMGQYDTLQVRVGYERDTDSYSVSTSTWYKPWTWGSSRSETRSTIVKYEYLAASDAVEQVSQYARECALEIEQQFNSIVSPSKLKAAMRRELISEMDTENKDFNPVQFRESLDRVLRTLVIPELHLDFDDAPRMISRQFQGEVRDSNMQALRDKLNEVLQTTFKELTQRFEVSIKHFAEALTIIQNGLELQLTESIREDLERVRQDFANKEKVLMEYQGLLTTIQQYRTTIN